MMINDIWTEDVVKLVVFLQDGKKYTNTKFYQDFSDSGD